jgi:hypothetical protein
MVVFSTRPAQPRGAPSFRRNDANAPHWPDCVSSMAQVPGTPPMLPESQMLPSDSRYSLYACCQLVDSVEA